MREGNVINELNQIVSDAYSLIDNKKIEDLRARIKNCFKIIKSNKFMAIKYAPLLSLYQDEEKKKAINLNEILNIIKSIISGYPQVNFFFFFF